MGAVRSFQGRLRVLGALRSVRAKAFTTACRRLSADELARLAQRMLLERPYDAFHEASRVDAERFPHDTELRLLHGTALVWRRPEDAGWELASAVALDNENPGLLLRAAGQLLRLGELAAVRAYIDQARRFAGTDQRITDDLDELERELSAAQAHPTAER